MTAQLRILCNEQNLIRTAVLLTPSSVAPADNTVLETPAARTGTAGVTLTGSYTGSEDATIDIEILDDTADVERASIPVLTGQGSETLTGITASGFSAQSVVVELKDAGIPILAAGLDFEGVKIVSRQTGADGNDISININAGIEDSPQGLTFSATDYSLLTALAAGVGSPTTGLAGTGYDWGQPPLGEDGVIPAGAPRVAFGDDTSAIYTAYKVYVDGAWSYRLVPALLRAVAVGTPVLFVTGGRTVTITDTSTSPVTVETYTDVATVYDLLSQIRELSTLVKITGIVANDRTPTGQAARELLARTDAHVEPSSGTGSRYATGFESAYAEAGAGTERVVARCYAVTGRDHPLAQLGSERWEIEGSLSGLLADAVTGVPYIATSWGFLIPRKLPPGIDTPRGGISAAVSYASRTEAETEPPICVVAKSLGPSAVDQSVTFTYRTRKTGECACDGLPVPNLSGACLGTFGEGDATMTYSADAVTRMKALYDWAGPLATAVTAYVSGFAADGIPETTVAAVAASAVEPNFAGTRAGLDGSTLSASGVLSAASFPLDSALVSAMFADFGLPATFQALVDTFETAVQLIDELDAGTAKSAGWTEWDAALAEAEADLAAGSPTDRWATLATDKYKILVRRALAYAGLSPMGKSDANSLTSGDGCWRDWGAAAWWVAESGGYAPVFTNHPYYSSRPSDDDGQFYSTHEFAFQVNVACTQYLKVGDQITITINDAARPSTYQIGDELVLPVIAAGDLALAGGQDGSTVQTWNVVGSDSGPLANYTLDTAAPSAYSASGLGFQITEGGIPSVVGDRFDFSIEGGHFQWRVDGGAWNTDSPPLDIPAAPLLLYAGLSATFTPGAAPSFAVGDVYSFRILQPRAASNVQTPGPESWQWVGDGQSIVIDLGSAQTISNIAIALHTIPAGATITVDGGTAPAVYPDSTTLTRVEGPIYKELTAAWTARYLRVTVAGASGLTVGYLFAGAPITTALAADLSLSRAYRVDRGSGGLYQGGRYLGKAVTGEIEWTEGALPESDVVALQACLDWIKAADDEPIIIVPNVTRPAEAFIGRVVVDEVEFPDVFMYGPDAGKARRHETRFPVAGVWS